MMMFYLDLVAAFVIPLLTVYLMGVFTRVHRKSGTVGLLAGVIYGVFRLIAAKVATSAGILLLPPWMIDSFASYPTSLAITAITMVLVSLALGFEPPGRLLHAEPAGWLRKSQVQAQPSDRDVAETRRNILPVILGVAVVCLGLVLSFLVFW
jgi:hypothetical protein